MDDYKVVPSGISLKEAKLREKVIKAYQAGMAIQIRRRTPPGDDCETWQDWVCRDEPMWQWKHTEYRIKPLGETPENGPTRTPMTVAKRRTFNRIKIMQAYVDGCTIQCRSRKERTDDAWVDTDSPRWDWDHAQYRIKPKMSLPQELIDQVGEALSAIHVYNMEQSYPDHVCIVPRPSFLYEHVAVEVHALEPVVKHMLPENSDEEVIREALDAVWRAMLASTEKTWGPPRRD